MSRTASSTSTVGSGERLFGSRQHSNQDIKVHPIYPDASKSSSFCWNTQSCGATSKVPGPYNILAGASSLQDIDG